MANNKQAVTVHKKDRGEFDFGSAVAVGLTLGMVFGMVLLDNIAVGMSFGLLLASLANAYHQKRQGEPRGNVALAVSIVTLLIAVAAWFFFTQGWF